MPRTNLHHNRRIRQEALREQLQQQGHVQHIVDLLDKIGDDAKPVQSDALARYKVVIDTKLRLINKYLPDVKMTEMEITGEDGGPVKTVVEFVRPAAD